MLRLDEFVDFDGLAKALSREALEIMPSRDEISCEMMLRLILTEEFTNRLSGANLGRTIRERTR